MAADEERDLENSNSISRRMSRTASNSTQTPSTSTEAPKDPPSYFAVNVSSPKEPSPLPPAYVRNSGESSSTGSRHNSYVEPAKPRLQTFTIEDFEAARPADEPLPTYAQDRAIRRRSQAAAEPPPKKNKKTLLLWVLFGLIVLAVTMGPSLAYVAKNPPNDNNSTPYWPGQWPALPLKQSGSSSSSSSATWDVMYPSSLTASTTACLPRAGINADAWACYGAFSPDRQLGDKFNDQMYRYTLYDRRLASTSLQYLPLPPLETTNIFFGVDNNSTKSQKSSHSGMSPFLLSTSAQLAQDCILSPESSSCSFYNQPLVLHQLGADEYYYMEMKYNKTVTIEANTTDFFALQMWLGTLKQENYECTFTNTVLGMQLFTKKNSIATSDEFKHLVSSDLKKQYPLGILTSESWRGHNVTCVDASTKSHTLFGIADSSQSCSCHYQNYMDGL